MEERPLARTARRALLAIAAAIQLLVSHVCLAVDGKPAATPPAMAAGQIDIRASRVFIFVGKTGLGHEHGVEGRIKEGALKLGATTNAGKIAFDTTTFQADTPDARKYVGLEGATDESTKRQVNANMLGPDVLDVAHFPTATFKIDSIQLLPTKADAPRQYQLEGEFTLHGVTRKLRMAAEATPASGFVRLRGKFAILQSEYGITPYTKAFGAIGVADQLTIWGDLRVATNTEPRR